MSGYDASYVSKRVNYTFDNAEEIIDGDDYGYVSAKLEIKLDSNSKPEKAVVVALVANILEEVRKTFA